MSGEVTRDGDGETLQLCRGIAKSLGDWQEEAAQNRQRSGTWRRWPFTFRFTEHAGPAKLGSTYDLTRLTAENVETEEHEYTGFYLDAQGVLVHVVRFGIPAGKLDDEQQRDLIADSIAFELANGLTTPGADDAVEVESELRQGFMDGVTPL